jgi:hypothetical protein
MKKKLTTILVIVLVLAILIGAGYIFTEHIYNRTIIDLTDAYDRAIIELPNGQIVEGKVESCTDYTDSDQIQVKVNGKIYLVHSNNVVLIKD